MGSIVVIGTDGQPAVGEERARRGLAAAPHRGMDIRLAQQGRFTLAAGADDLDTVAVGSARGLTVAFVGSLDNAADVASRLGVATEGAGPPDIVDILAAAFRVWGPEFPGQLRGVFSGAVTDGTTLHAFRDHVGYRPLFYRQDGAGFVAATEAKQVVAAAGIAREPDLDVVSAILFRRLDDESPSALRGVRRLPKASVLVVADGHPTTRRYWDPAALLETVRYSPTELQERFDVLMAQAVARSLTGRDVVSLSGGIDSPAIAAYAAPIYRERFGRPLPAQTVVYPNHPTVDERRYVVPLAERLGLPLHQDEQHANPLAEIGDWVRVTDTPYSAAALGQYAEDFRRARERGYRTVLTGEHAEFVTAMIWSLFEHYVFRGRMRAAGRHLRLRRRRGDTWPGLLRFVLRSLAPGQLLAARRAVLRTPVRGVPAWIDRRQLGVGDTAPPWNRWRMQQLRGFTGPGISLEAEEVCEAVTGVRSRRPWTDVDLWELFLSLDAEQQFPDLRPKGLVRNLLRGRVPDEILDRQDKTVFDAAALASIDYDTLRRYLVDPRHRLDGVDYPLLQRRLDARDLDIVEFGWARTLTSIHAFLDQW